MSGNEKVVDRLSFQRTRYDGWVVAGLAIFLALTMGWSAMHPRQPDGVVGVDRAATAFAVDAFAKRLQAADDAGDIAGAVTLLDPLRRLLDRAATSPPKDDAVRLCFIAASHVTDGAIRVAQGGRWATRDRYEAAMARCR